MFVDDRHIWSERDSSFLHTLRFSFFLFPRIRRSLYCDAAFHKFFFSRFVILINDPVRHFMLLLQPGFHLFGALMSPLIKIHNKFRMAISLGLEVAEEKKKVEKIPRNPGHQGGHTRRRIEKKGLWEGYMCFFSSLMKREGHYKAQREVLRIRTYEGKAYPGSDRVTKALAEWPSA